MINIILAEDHNIVRDGLRSLIAGEPDFTVVAEARNGKEVIDLLDKGLEASILLTDLSMPHIGGLELTGIVKQRYPEMSTIILSAHDNEKYVLQSFKAGANGFLLKSIAADELRFAVRHVSSGNQYICSELTIRFLNRILTIPEPVQMDTMQDMAFTEREIETLSLLASGMTSQQIADRLFTSKRTIEGYRESMISKTGVPNTAALVRFAVVHGIIN